MVSETVLEAGRRDFEVIIVGGGPSGIGAAIQLGEAGITDLVLLEKGATLGGTWRDNTYPGCACDVPSALYSYSFAPNPEWTRAFASQPEILAYLERVAEARGVGRRARLGVEVRRARWDRARHRWFVETSEGTYSARFLVSATGPWHEPKVAQIPGLTEFPGEVFHSSRWNHGYAFRGKRVAVVGSGASAVQFVPKIQRDVARLHLFQRTAQWVLPKPDHAVPPFERWVMRALPFAQRALRAAEYVAMEAFGVGFRYPWLLERLQRSGLRHLERTVTDPVLRARLTPSYTLGCKRVLLSNSYYRALAQPNVDVYATALARIDGRRAVGADGSSAEVDAIVFGTGFQILAMPIADRIFDGDGVSLAATWKGSPTTYLGTVVSGFPNLFLLLGPGLGTGYSSAFTILEAQLRYVTSALRKIRAQPIAAVDVRADVQAAYNAAVQQALQRTVYNSGGCSSYYLDANGRNSFSWPWSTFALERRVRTFDLRDYEVATSTKHLSRRVVRAEECV
jgi:cation diffusion facilitator CzcD-associated flavoprotein CzcO